MKKSKKFVAALAISAALAMGAAPAFAADVEVGNPGAFQGDENSASATTAVTMFVSDSDTQIQATVPVAITIVTPSAGGVITAPTANAYKIANNGQAPLKVTAIQGIDDEWAFVDTLGTGENQINMTIQAGSSTPLTIKSSSQTINDSFFQIPAEDTLGLTLAGKTAVKSPLDVNKTYPAVKIAYTIAPVA